MALYPGSVRQVADVTPADVVLVDANGAPVFGFNPSRPATATLTQPPVNNVPSVIAASNPARRKLFVVNTSGKVLYLAFAATATTAAYTANVPNGGAWENDADGYTGDVAAILASGSGTIRVTEVA